MMDYNAILQNLRGMVPENVWAPGNQQAAAWRQQQMPASGIFRPGGGMYGQMQQPPQVMQQYASMMDLSNKKKQNAGNV